MAVRSILVSILLLLVSKNQNCVFENSREKGIQRIIPYVEHVDRSHQQRVDVYLFPGAAILSESKKEREREKIGEKKQNKNTRDG